MAVTLRSQAELDRLLAAGGLLAIDFADAADAAKRFSERFDAVAMRFVDSGAFVRAALPDAAPLAALFGIESAPALVVFRDGVGLYAGPAPASAPELEALLRRASSLDMAVVHREIAERHAAESALALRRVCPTARRGNLS
ncbi:MAG: hypothetical protein KIT73_15095 [Burkholderiales bacterium]|nr:hypothetical protein [Burkholderiales bacterium]